MIGSLIELQQKRFQLLTEGMLQKPSRLILNSRVNSAFHQAWIDAAIDQAEKSWSEGGIPIGSVLALSDTGEIVARGHNERVQSDDPTAHAEVSCIRHAGRRRDWSELTLTSTLSPCCMCSGTAILFRIPTIVIGENRTFMGAEEWMRSQGAQLIVLDDPRCVELMNRMIREKPDLWAEDIGK